VLEVIDAVKRVSGCDFPAEIGGRRAGDPASLVADVSRIRSTLDWRPRFDDLDTIVAHALAWERLLAKRKTAAA
jgi:UDP-glucose 4-epimerase